MAPYAEQLGSLYMRPRPIDMRYVDWNPPDRNEPLPPHQRVWLRAAGRLPDDAVLHACVPTYASDMSLLDTALLPHGGSWHSPDLFMASLDHAMWFHRPFRADERSEEHTSELQSLMRISYAVFCLKKKK